MNHSSIMRYISFILAIFLFFNISAFKFVQGQTVHIDRPFLQNYSIKYLLMDSGTTLFSTCSDRNGNIRIFSSTGVLLTNNGHFLYPGSLQLDNRYRTTVAKKIQGISTYRGQFIYVDDKSVFSNAWAGSLFLPHQLSAASILVGGSNNDFLVSDGNSIHYITNQGTLFKTRINGEIIELHYEPNRKGFIILTSYGLLRFDPKRLELESFYLSKGLTSLDLNGGKAWIGSHNGFYTVDLKTGICAGPALKIPVLDIRCVRAIGNRIWFGTANGAFATRVDGKFDYYQGDRWFPGQTVLDIEEGPDGSVLLLTEAGLGQICFKYLTLADKAAFYQSQVRSRHIRNGLNASLAGMKKGDLSTGYLSDSDNDGLWTSLYLGAEVFRYAVTRSKDALANISESLDAIQRLYSINPIPGFPSRSIERRGFINILNNPERWLHSPDPEWDWKATTSSDEVIGHIFAFGAIAELVHDSTIRNKAISLLDNLMKHILINDLYLIDFDGKPTLWGKWNPAYVNTLPVVVGDRKLNSSNIIAMLQTAYRFTGNLLYKNKAFELMKQHGYLENLMRPMHIIGEAGGDADEHAKMLSDRWNHSDDEMYFLGYWGLYRYAFNDTLRSKYKRAIIDHWEIERPEKEGLWNIFTAITGKRNFDIAEAIFYLQEYPLDLIDWSVLNSHRKDIEPLKKNFRGQTIKEVLPPDERPVQRHNANMFELDRNNGSHNGTSEYSAGDIWLLPYWMGRYLGLISAPEKYRN